MSLCWCLSSRYFNRSRLYEGLARERLRPHTIGRARPRKGTHTKSEQGPLCGAHCCHPVPVPCAGDRDFRAMVGATLFPPTSAVSAGRSTFSTSPFDGEVWRARRFSAGSLTESQGTINSQGRGHGSGLERRCSWDTPWPWKFVSGRREKMARPVWKSRGARGFASGVQTGSGHSQTLGDAVRGE